MYICKICNNTFNEIKELSKHLTKEHGFSASQLYDYYNYSFETGEAMCPICGSSFTMTKRQMDGFKKNPNKSIGCCTKCSKAVIMITHDIPLANPEVQEKIKKTLIKKYGVEHPAQAKEVMDKMKKTTFERYGVENSLQSKEVQEKRKKTNLKKYGVEFSLASKEVREKITATILNKYGVKNAFQAEEIKEKIKRTNMEHFGTEHAIQSEQVQNKMKRTNLKKYGVEYPIQSQEIKESMKKTNLERYGAESPFGSNQIQKKARETMTERYGVEHAMQSPIFKEKVKKENLKRYGTEYPVQLEEVKEKIKQTNLEKYGVEHFCQHEKCYKNSYNRISKVNRSFKILLESNGIESELEYIINNSGYDLKVGNTLIEINPWFTHNSTVGPTFGDKVGKPRQYDYHLSKTNEAKNHGFDCIHIFDWDEREKVIYLLQPKSKVYARECEVKKINKKEANDFLNAFHLQCSTKQVQYAYGLYYGDKLVQVMTFGKPRYNKNYEYELLRLCTIPEHKVIGGASKLLNFFEKNVKPKSIISYCDLSKFSGHVYEKLGFTLSNQTQPSKHWYNYKIKRHITDNFLRQRGFDQLHGTYFGKGTSNEQLMLEHGYVEIFDCGQLVFTKSFINN